MSICNCPIVGIDGIESSKQKQLVAGFLESLAAYSQLSAYFSKLCHSLSSGSGAVMAISCFDTGCTNSM